MPTKEQIYKKLEKLHQLKQEKHLANDNDYWRIRKRISELETLVLHIDDIESVKIIDK